MGLYYVSSQEKILFVLSSFKGQFIACVRLRWLKKDLSSSPTSFYSNKTIVPSNFQACIDHIVQLSNLKGPNDGEPSFNNIGGLNEHCEHINGCH